MLYQPKKQAVLQFTMEDGRIAGLLAILATFLLTGAVGEVAAHGPCHANPGTVPDIVCSELPSGDAPRG